MDRCALFVDAGYLLADGAMAVHGTRHREVVSWDYPGLLKLLNSLSKERTGLPLLRCYWYEATIEGRRTPEHEALADIPGLKLRLSRIRPGRREGVDAQVHRDLMTLARSGAVCDAVVVSGDEDLAQVVCDAQDLGVRVTVVHIAADGGWAVSRSLRQECDDLIEITVGHLRPYVNLINGVGESPALANGHQPTANGQVTASPGHNAPPLAPGQETRQSRPAPSQPALSAYSSYTRDVPAPPASQPPQPPAPQAPPPTAPNPPGSPAPTGSPGPSGPRGSSIPPTGPLPPAPPYGQGNTGGTHGYQTGQLGVYTGPQPAPVPVQNAPGGAPTLSDAVKAAHKEGHDFGESVAKDAPALWLEAVLARKPRMPSDLEARLLQGSSLPIDFLLHDEVRHALRRGFWDALERARR